MAGWSSRDITYPRNIISCLQEDQGCQFAPLSMSQRNLSSQLEYGRGLYSVDLKGHYGCVNAIAFSRNGEEFLASGGDDKRVLIWKMASAINCSAMPTALKGTHELNIFSLVFSCDNAFVYSSGNDGQILKHDFGSGEVLRHYQHTASIFSLDSTSSSPHVVAAATEDGFLFIVDTRLPQMKEDMILEQRSNPYHSVSFNPLDSCLLVAGNAHDGSALFDTRTMKKLFSYQSARFPVRSAETVSVTFNSTGSQVYTMSRNLPPTICDTSSPQVKWQFVDEGGTYRNSVTMKSGCFAGDRDEYVVSGSDDFMIYWWRVPDGPHTCEPSFLSHEIPSHMVVPGHRSIVNQTRYSSTHHVLCSSGVEKIIKLWSAFPLHGNQVLHQSKAPPARQSFTNDELDDMYPEMLYSFDDDSDPCMEESPQVLAFFDHLIQHEKEDEEDDDSDAQGLSSESESSCDMPMRNRFLLRRFRRQQQAEVNSLGAGQVIYEALATDSDASSYDFVRSLTPDEHTPPPAIVTIGPCSSDHIRNVMMLELRSDDDDKDSSYRIQDPDVCATNGHDSASAVDDCEATRKRSVGSAHDSTLFRLREPTDNNLFHVARHSPGGSSLAAGVHAEDLDFLRQHFSSSRTRKIPDDKSCSGNKTSL